MLKSKTIPIESPKLAHLLVVNINKIIEEGGQLTKVRFESGRFIGTPSFVVLDFVVGDKV